MAARCFPWTFFVPYSIYTLPETNSSPLKMDGWNTIGSFWDGLFSGAMSVSGRVDPIDLCKVCMCGFKCLMDMGLISHKGFGNPQNGP